MKDQPIPDAAPSNFEQLNHRQNRTLQLTIVNFVLFLVLFSVLVYVSWQSSMLVDRINDNITRAETAIASVQTRIGELEDGELLDRAITRISENLRESISVAVADSPGLTGLRNISERVQEIGTTATQTAEAVQAVSEKIVSLDGEALADRVAYNLLKGMGEGFNKAAEARNPGDS